MRFSETCEVDMKKEDEFSTGDALDGSTIEALTQLYEPPADSAYWSSLESRVLARLTRSGVAYGSRAGNMWSVLGQWAVPGLAAAAVLFIIAAALLSRLESRELSTAYDTFAQPAVAEALPDVSEVLAERDRSAQREATFRYVISH